MYARTGMYHGQGIGYCAQASSDRDRYELKEFAKIYDGRFNARKLHTGTVLHYLGDSDHNLVVRTCEGGCQVCV